MGFAFVARSVPGDLFYIILPLGLAPADVSGNLSPDP